jgi:CRISPR-associated endonuclease Cas3-HD
MKREYFAHSVNDKMEKHPLARHLRETSLLAELFAGQEEYKPLFKLSGLLHDLGKYQPEFQHYLENGGRRGSVPHARWGAGYARKFKMNDVSIAIDGHHKGLPDIQLCAQAICLEEMFHVPVPKGALYWHGSRERRDIVFTDGMRRQVEEVALKIAEMLKDRITPPPVNDKRCEGCSLKESCLPDVVANKNRSSKAARELFVI